MILATTETIGGREIAGCLGIVTSEAIADNMTLKSLMASISDQVAQRKEWLFNTREAALQTLADHSSARGGDAVVGIRLDYVIDSTGHIMVAAQGTAVRLRS